MTTETKWSIDPSHSEITFKVRHLMIAYVKGAFKVFDANIITDNKDFSTSKISLSIDASSLTTGDEKRDNHLMGADFFNVKDHQQITFVSTSIQKADMEGDYELCGNLTINEITNPIMLNAKFGGAVIDPWGNEKVGFVITGKINRTAWGLSWNVSLEAGGIMLSEDVLILCEIELINADEKNIVAKI